MKTKPKKARSREVRAVRELKARLSRRQLIALSFPIPLGKPAQRLAERFVQRQVRGAVTWCQRLTLDCNGAPELVGPCWHIEVWQERVAGQRVLVSEWTLADQEHAKQICLHAVKTAGHGEQLDVQVGQSSLQVYKLATVLEAAVATSVMLKDAGEAATLGEVSDG